MQHQSAEIRLKINIILGIRRRGTPTWTPSYGPVISILELDLDVQESEIHLPLAAIP